MCFGRLLIGQGVLCCVLCYFNVDSNNFTSMGFCGKDLAATLLLRRLPADMNLWPSSILLDLFCSGWLAVYGSSFSPPFLLC